MMTSGSSFGESALLGCKPVGNSSHLIYFGDCSGQTTAKPLDHVLAPDPLLMDRPALIFPVRA